MITYELHEKRENCSVCRSVHLSMSAAVHHATVYGFRPGTDFILEVPNGPDYPEPYNFARKIDLTPCDCSECSAWRQRSTENTK